MGRTELPQIKLREVLRGFHEHRRLVTAIRTMALELERVNEDNAQLRAAILMYREVMRRTGAGRLPAGANTATHQNSQRARSTLLRKKLGAGAS
jgi:hypothetical protein